MLDLEILVTMEAIFLLGTIVVIIIMLSLIHL